MRLNHFTRPTLAAALEVLKERLSAADFDMLAFELGLAGRIDTSLTTPKKAVQLAIAIEVTGDSIIPTLDGPVTIKEAVVRRAVARMYNTEEAHLPDSRLRRGLALDGFVVTFEEDARSQPLLRAALPHEVDLPKTDDNVHALLKLFSFSTSLGHLDQATDAHTRGDWAASNAQARTFIESLLDDIARAIDAAGASAAGTSEGRRQLLRQHGFLREDLNEMTTDGKSFINGFFKMLHSQGSHPGLSDEDHSTFRLHLILVTSHMLLRRLQRGSV